MKYCKFLIINFFIIFAFYTNLEAKLQNRILLKVNNEIITSKDLELEIRLINYLNKGTLKKRDIDSLQKIGIQSLIKKTIKEEEIKRYAFNRFSEKDLELKLESIQKSLALSNRDLKISLKKIGLSYEHLKKKIILELKWNGLIFDIYKNNLAISENEIREELKNLQSKANYREFLLSEISIKHNPGTKDKDTRNLIKSIKKKGFSETAKTLSISESSENGGNLGWISENQLNDEIMNLIKNGKKGSLTEFLITTENILILKINDIRSKKIDLDLKKITKQIINKKKHELLERYSATHFQKLRNNALISIVQ